MSWSSRFRDALASPPAPMVFRLTFETHRNAVSQGPTLSGVPGDSAPVVFDTAPPSITGTSITPGPWSPSWGSASVTVTSEAFADVQHELRRGAVATIWAGFAGWSLSHFQPIFRGVLKNWSGDARTSWRLEFWDLLAGYRTRQTTEPGNYPDPANPSQFPLFWDLGKPVTLTSTYNVGDSTLDVTDGSPFNVDGQHASLGGVCKVSPSGGGSPFFLPFTSRSGNQLQGIPVAPIPGVPTAPGTWARAAAGSAVQPIAWLRGHPADIARRLLVSGSVSGSSGWNTYPSPWNFQYGIPEAWLALGDMAVWESLVLVDSTGTPGAYAWDVMAEAPVDDAMGWFQSFLSAAGMWLIQRQGEFTIRGCQDVDNAGSLQPFGTRFAVARGGGVVTLGEAELVRFNRWTAFHPSVSYVAGVSAMVTANGQTGRGVAKVDSLPAVDVVQHDLSAAIRDPVAWQQYANGDLYRLQKWDLAAPEVVSATWSMSPAAELVAGDVVFLHLPDRRGRLPSTRAGFFLREATVLSVSHSWASLTVDVELAVQPWLSELPRP